MKIIAWLTLGAGLAGTAWGQGRVSMNSVQAGAYVRFSNVVTQAWAQNTAGSQPGSMGWINVGLYWGVDPEHLDHLAGPLATVGSDVKAGMVLTSTGGGARRIVDGQGQPVISPVCFQLRAWTGPYATWEEAAASGDPNVNVSRISGLLSAPMTLATPNRASYLPITIIFWGGTYLDPLVVEMGPLIVGVPMPEPGTLTLLGIGLTALVVFRRRA